MQENRSFDNYFGVLGAYRANRACRMMWMDSIRTKACRPRESLEPDQAYHFRTQCTSW